MGNNYISELLASLKSKQESNSKKPKYALKERKRFESRRKRVLSEDAHKDAILEILENLEGFKHEFKHKILIPSKRLDVNPDASVHKLNDRSNPHIAAVYRVEDAIHALEKQLKIQLQDPFMDEDNETGAEAPTSDEMTIPDTGSEPSIQESACRARVQKNEDSDTYFRKLYPELAAANDAILKLNGWNYANNEIWDDTGVCSIVYEPDEDEIFIFELMDPDGVDQQFIASCHDVDELDTALTNFVELQDIAPEMKERFAEYIDAQRGIEANEDDMDVDLTSDTGDMMMDDSSVELSEDEKNPMEPVDVDGWIYTEMDTEYNGNQTLFYEDEELMVLIQKDAELEEDEPNYLVMVGEEDEPADELEADDMEEICTWLEMNGYPVPTEDAKNTMIDDETINESAGNYGIAVVEDIGNDNELIDLKTGYASAEDAEEDLDEIAEDYADDPTIELFVVYKEGSSWYDVNTDEEIVSNEDESMNLDETINESACPKGMKCVKNDPAISKVAKKVNKAKVSKVDMNKKAKKENK